VPKTPEKLATHKGNIMGSNVAFTYESAHQQRRTGRTFVLGINRRAWLFLTLLPVVDKGMAFI